VSTGGWWWEALEGALPSASIKKAFGMPIRLKIRIAVQVMSFFSLASSYLSVQYIY